MADDSDDLVPMTVPELRKDLGALVRYRIDLMKNLADARATAGPFEGMGIVANSPHVTQARQALNDLPVEIAKIDAQVDDLSKTLTNRILEDERTAREGRDFWFRRFILSLQIGNGAAFLATVTGMFQAEKDVLSIMAALAWAPALYFALGVGTAGALPLLMFAETAVRGHKLRESLVRHTVVALTTFSMGFFVLGAGSVVVQITQMQKPAVDAAAAATAAARAQAASAKTSAVEGKGRKPVEATPQPATERSIETAPG